MNLNRIMLLSIFLLAILTVGVASASENITDNLEIKDTVSQDDNLAASNDLVSDEVLSNPKDVEIKLPDNIKAGETFYINVTLPEDDYDNEVYYSGNVFYHFDDDDEEDDLPAGGGFNTIPYKTNTFGSCTLHVSFVPDDTSLLNPKEVSKEYNINDYAIEVTAEDDEWFYGKSTELSFSIPSDTGKYVVDVNGKLYNLDLEEYEESINYGPANAANVVVKVTYNGDGKKLKAKTVTKVFEILPYVNCPKEVPFATSKDVTVAYADGESIDFKIKHYDNEVEDDVVIDEKTVTVKDSKAVYSIPSNLQFGDYYELVVSHNGNEYFNSFKITPQIDVPNTFYSKETYNIPVTFPEQYKNMDIEVFIGDNTVFEGKLDSNAKTNIILSNLEANDGTTFYIKISSGDDFLTEYQKDVKVSDNDPSSVDLSADISKQFVKGQSLDFELALFDDISGEVVAYIDGVEVAREDAREYVSFYLKTDDLKVNSHTLTLNYTGDDYYKPASVSYVFDLVEYKVVIPENPCYNNGDRIYVEFQEDATGTLIFYADGKEVQRFSVEDDRFESENGYAVGCLVDDLNLALGPHDIRVYYTGNKAKLDLTKKINLDYTVQFAIEEYYYYGEDNFIEITVPQDATGSFKINIDGKEVEYTTEESDLRVNISEFFGEHVVTIEYAGDSKYNHPLTVNTTFNVISYINFDDNIPYNYDGEVISLLLPKDAKGNLVAEIDDQVYVKKGFENGKAVISFKDLDIGNYNVRAYYEGDDYDVDEVVRDLQIEGKIEQSHKDGEIPYNQAVDFYINLPKNTVGTLKVTLNGREFTKEMVDGYAKVTVSGFRLGENSYAAEFICDAGDDRPDYSTNTEGSLDVIPVVKISDNMVVFGKNIVSVFAPSGFNGYIEYEIDYATYKQVKANSQKTDISLGSLTAGAHELYIRVFDEDEYVFGEYYDLNVSKAAAPKLFATSAVVYCGDYYNRAKVLGVDGKPLKGAKVLFKVGANKYVIRLTNAYGIATLLMNYKPAKYVVLVKYSTQTVKPIVLVKKVLTLNNLIVKKSAKQIILAAALKKGKIPIKNKWVVFKFNGRTFKAKTNSLGVAKVVVKNVFFKNLKVGRNVIYQATYLKDFARKVVKVRR
ncbi:hypothetical protein [uncultured Methanobrevibacter sp.]|uniref:hypothetical protein n=1 Tax=uncultured Methanobrevibacter sp. TaxID=253161 RepID=UPI0025E8766C|nr:hypothetical protein [uncultured Methanobrevibacter sp.]